MKLLFVENRSATWVHEAVARRLAADGHEIHWLVQNPVFAPRWGQVHLLAFPPRGGAMAETDSYAWLRRTDRGVLHFGVRGDHYAHYDCCIAAVLKIVAPDVVFGEPTEFHELLTIACARKIGLPYLSPNVTRYPTNRLAFHAYDTLDPVGGDGSTMSDDEADALIDAIRMRQVVPSYMRPPERVTRSQSAGPLALKLRITAGWLAGERFNTPSPVRKLALNRTQRRQRLFWERRAERRASDWPRLLDRMQPWVLYALQMQPESNIDVWGTPWNDQAEIIRRAARSLAEHGAMLVVKPNPKSKYEMSPRLNEVMDSEANVLGLAHATPMGEVFPLAPLVLAVTGTVLLESIFAGKPVAVLGGHGMRDYPGVTGIESPEDLPPVLDAATKGRACAATRHEARSLLQYLHATSYAATIWDPVSHPADTTEKNISALTTAFTRVLEQIQCRPLTLAESMSRCATTA